MYDAADTIYCYPNSDVLKNLADLRSAKALEEFETAMTAQRAEEPLPAGRLSVSHFLAVHRHLFQDIYAWAGKPRRIRLRKGERVFCYPEHIDAELHKLFGDLKQDNYLRDLAPDKFAERATRFLAMLNAIHAFREGNGRTQLAFLALLADRAGHPLYLQDLREDRFLKAMIASFSGDETLLKAELLHMTV